MAIHNINNSRFIFSNNNYMMTIKKHLEQDPSRADEFNVILQRRTITLEQWRATGKFIPAEEYLNKNPNAKLIRNCKDVIEYAGMSIIELTHTGDFVFEKNKSKDIEEIENIVWRNASEKLWCENC